MGEIAEILAWSVGFYFAGVWSFSNSEEEFKEGNIVCCALYKTIGLLLFLVGSFPLCVYLLMICGIIR